MDTRVIGNDLSLPETQPSDEFFLSYACPTNAQRNQITDNNFDDLVRRTHPVASSHLAAPDNVIAKTDTTESRNGDADTRAYACNAPP